MFRVRVLDESLLQKPKGCLKPAFGVQARVHALPALAKGAKLHPLLLSLARIGSTEHEAVKAVIESCLNQGVETG